MKEKKMKIKTKMLQTASLSEFLEKYNLTLLIEETYADDCYNYRVQIESDISIFYETKLNNTTSENSNVFGEGDSQIEAIKIYMDKIRNRNALIEKLDGEKIEITIPDLIEIF